MKRLFGAVIAMLMALLLLASCNGGIGNLLIPVKSVAISEPSLEMIIGDQKALDVIVSPSDASNRKVTWSSSKPEVANVNSQGVVEALSVGMTIITVETVDGGYKTASCSVTVNGKENQLSLTPSWNVTEGLTYGTNGTISISNPSNGALSIVTEPSSAVATASSISADGRITITPVASGETSITIKSAQTATFKEATQTLAIKVIKANVDLSAGGTANSYIVTGAGAYKIPTVQGNTTTSVGSVASAEVLWESFGTSTAPSKGDLVSNATYSDGYISFSASSLKGNAVIAAKDASGNILWSWHIWLTDKPEDQVYNNNAGTMMDRNLGATSATPGDVKALGLLYQWGRKDPFLSGGSISSNTKAKSTITWPSRVSSTSSNGTIAYAIAHPTTFITYNSSNYDWYYTGSSSTDNTRWQTSYKAKGLYDPCPAGYRVPDGSSNGVWAKAFGTNSYWSTSSNWDSTNRGMNFGKTDKKLGSASTIWYSAAGYLSSNDGSLINVGNGGNYWSCTPDSYDAYSLYFYGNGSVNPSGYDARAHGQSVRCLRE